MLYAQFERAINYLSSEGLLASLVSPAIGSGPGYIVLDHLPVPAPSHIEVKSKCVICGSNTVLKSELPVYEPRLTLQCRPTAAMINERARGLVPLFPKGSPAFLFDDTRGADFNTDFEKAYLAQFKQGVAVLTEGKHEKGTRLLKGLGTGLTPSGDDFLCGFLWALSLLAPHHDTARDTMYRNALGNNPVVNHFLRAAHEGLFFERFKNFTYALCDGTSEETHAAFGSLLTVGATSGADTAAGLLMGLRDIK